MKEGMNQPNLLNLASRSFSDGGGAKISEFCKFASKLATDDDDDDDDDDEDDWELFISDSFINIYYNIYVELSFTAATLLFNVV